MIIVVFASCAEKITGSGLTIFNGAYPVHYECHDSAVYSNGLNYSMYYWNHGLQREARIEAVGVCFNGCEWECV